MSTTSDAYDLWKTDPTPDNMAGVVTALEPAIMSEVYRYPGPKPLLRAKAKSLAIKQVHSFDPNRGTKLRSWVVTGLQPLSRYGQRLRPVRAPEVAIRQAAEVNRIREEMMDEMGRDPELVELADRSGISTKRIKHLRRSVVPAVAESRFVTEEGAPWAPSVAVETGLDASQDAVYDSLDKRDKQIFDWKTGKHGKAQLPNQEIARKLGVSAALISQRSAQIAAQITELQQRGVF